MPLRSWGQKKSRTNSAGHKLDRMRQASEKARERLHSGKREVDVLKVPLSWWRERWDDLAIQQQFIENFLKVRDGFHQNRLVPFVLTDLQKTLHYEAARKTVVLKGRGAKSTRYWLARGFAKAVVKGGVTMRVVPHDTDAEEELFNDLKIFYENLPDHLRPLTRYYSKELIHFHDPAKEVYDSRITTLLVAPGHETKGRSMTITDLILTELPFWRCDQDVAVTSLTEALRGGRVVSESTANGLEQHYKFYSQGKKGEGGWKAFFFPWWYSRDYRVEGAWLDAKGEQVWVRYTGESGEQRAELTAKDQTIAKVIFRHLCKFGYLGRSAGWKCDAVAEYMAWRDAKRNEIGVDKFKVEYPENDKDCFEQSGRPVVSAELLKVTCKPSDALEGHGYLIIVDPSEGLERGDPAAIQVIDLNTGRQAREIEVRKRPDLLAGDVGELSDEYNYAQIVVEVNGVGLACVQELERLGYGDRLYRQLTNAQKIRIEDGDSTLEEELLKAPAGIKTTKVNKPLMGAALERHIRQGTFLISSEAFCDQAKTVNWNDAGGFAAINGGHDDLFMGAAIGAYIREYEMGQQSAFVGVLPEFGMV